MYGDVSLQKFSFDCFSFLRELAKSSAEGGDERRGTGRTKKERRKFEIVVWERELIRKTIVNYWTA